VLVAFVLPAQDLAQQGARARHRPVAARAPHAVCLRAPA
jgi:hypothetical protein